MNKYWLTAGAAMVTAMILSACGGSSGDPLAGGESSGSSSDGTVTIGSANFPESALIAEIYAGALQAKGVKVNTNLNIGSRDTYIPALEDGSIDLLPEYSGALLLYFDKTAPAVSSADVYAALPAALPADLTVLDKSAAEDKDGIAVTRQTAAKYSLTTIADLASVAKDLTIGAAPEFQTNPAGVPGLKAKYGVTFKKLQRLDAGGPLTVNALKKGQVQAADLFSTDPAIAANQFVVLQDPKSLFTAQNVLPLISKQAVTPTVTDALNAVSARLDTPELSRLVASVAVDGEDPANVAKTWLTEQKLS